MRGKREGEVSVSLGARPTTRVVLLAVSPSVKLCNKITLPSRTDPPSMFLSVACVCFLSNDDNDDDCDGDERVVRSTSWQQPTMLQCWVTRDLATRTQLGLQIVYICAPTRFFKVTILSTSFLWNKFSSEP